MLTILIVLLTFQVVSGFKHLYHYILQKLIDVNMLKNIFQSVDHFFDQGSSNKSIKKTDKGISLPANSAHSETPRKIDYHFGLTSF